MINYNITINQLTDNNVDDYNSRVSTLGEVVWEHEFSLNDIDVYLYTDVGTEILANSINNEINPQIAGNHVTWQTWDGNDWEVYSAEISAI